MPAWKPPPPGESRRGVARRNRPVQRHLPKGRVLLVLFRLPRKVHDAVVGHLGELEHQARDFAKSPQVEVVKFGPCARRSPPQQRCTLADTPPHGGCSPSIGDLPPVAGRERRTRAAPPPRARARTPPPAISDVGASPACATAKAATISHARFIAAVFTAAALHRARGCNAYGEALRGRTAMAAQAWRSGRGSGARERPHLMKSTCIAPEAPALRFCSPRSRAFLSPRRRRARATTSITMTPMTRQTSTWSSGVCAQVAC
jgi:hypothetical protein